MKRQRLGAAAGGRRGGGSRDAILKAAERVFADAGLAGARTDAIARAAGVNKALLYYYFKSKDALYLAVLENHMKEFNRRGLEVLMRPGSPRRTLLEYVGMHFDFMSSRPNYPRLFHRLVISGGSGLERLAEKYFQPVRRRLIRIIERGVHTGEFRRVESRHAAVSIVGLAVFNFAAAPVVRKVTNVDPYSKAHLAQRRKGILDLVRYGLFRKPEDRF
jgi:TetR/AcrR family transcriptional regulator